MGWQMERVGTEVVRCRFDGHLSDAEGRASAEALVALLRLGPHEVIFDVAAMTGYDSGARRAWQEALLPLRTQVRALRVLGGSSLVRMGATAMGLALGIPVNPA